MRRLGLLGVGILMVALTGCARGPGGGVAVPEWVAEFFVQFAGPVDDTSHYFIAIDADSDYGLDGPLPVAAGPYWGNGWGTGSITHFISYTQGRYDVYRTNRQLQVTGAGGGIVGATGSPEETDTGEYRLTVGTVAFGGATLGGTGTITGVANDSSQNAGQFSIETDGTGRTVAGQVSFAPASDGGRSLSAAEQPALDALNAGTALAADSLAPFGLSLTLGAPAAGVQTIDVAPAVADVGVRFESSGGTVLTSTGTVTANSKTSTSDPPIPGATLTTQTLVQGGVARILSQTSPASTLIGTPYESVAPLGGSQLDVTIDLATIGTDLDHISVNFISTTELIFDPTVTDVSQHCYDGLSDRRDDAGDAYITFTLRQTRTISNGDGTARETGGDRTLAPNGPFTQQERDSVDILDWRIIVRRLSG